MPQAETPAASKVTCRFGTPGWVRTSDLLRVNSHTKLFLRVSVSFYLFPVQSDYFLSVIYCIKSVCSTNSCGISCGLKAVAAAATLIMKLHFYLSNTVEFSFKQEIYLDKI